MSGVGRGDVLQLFFQLDNALALLVDVGLVFLRRVEQCVDQLVAELAVAALDQFAGKLGLLVDGEAEAEAEFGVVFEQRVRPGRAAAFAILRPGSRGQVAAVDRGAAGGVGDQRAISEKLREQLEVGRFAAARAGAGEFEQRLLHLLLADGSDLDRAAVEFGDFEEEVPVVALGNAQRRLRRHVEGLETRLLLVLDRADVDADAAAGAVFGRDLDGILEAGPLFVARRGGLERGGSAFQLLRIVDLDADHRVRTNHGALAALDADVRVPDGNFEREIALLPLGGSSGEGAVDGEGADGQLVATIFVDRAQNVSFKVRGVGGEGLGNLDRARDLGRNLHFVQVGERFVHRLHVFLDDVFTLAAVGVANRLANRFDGARRRAGPWKWRRSRPAGSCSCGCPCRCRARRCSRRSQTGVLSWR